MAETLTGSKISKLVSDGKVIENGNIKNCGTLKYDFSISEDILKSDFNAPVKMSELTVEQRRTAQIMPGEVVYVLTKEKVNLPKDMYMSLSANRGMSESGVLTLGGFAVDPGYSGRLMFGLYNYSSTPYPIVPGDKLIGGVFYQFDDKEKVEVKSADIPQAIDEFPTRLISIISKYSPIGMSSMEESVKAISIQVEALKNELSKRREEVYDLRHAIQETQDQTNRTSRAVNDLSSTVSELTESVKRLSLDVSELRGSLQEEIQLRKGTGEDLENKLEVAKAELSSKMQFLKGAMWLATAIVGAVTTIIISWLTGHFTI